MLLIVKKKKNIIKPILQQTIIFWSHQQVYQDEQRRDDIRWPCKFSNTRNPTTFLICKRSQFFFSVSVHNSATLRIFTLIISTAYIICHPTGQLLFFFFFKSLIHTSFFLKPFFLLFFGDLSILYIYKFPSNYMVHQMKKTFYSTHSFSDMVMFIALNSHFVTPPPHFKWHITLFTTSMDFKVDSVWWWWIFKTKCIQGASWQLWRLGWLKNRTLTELLY